MQILKEAMTRSRKGEKSIGFLICSWNTNIEVYYALANPLRIQLLKLPGDFFIVNFHDSRVSSQHYIHKPCISSEGFDSIQIHHTGTFHWVTSTTFGRPRCAMARIMDSKSAGSSLSSSLECQIARIYSSKKEKFTVEMVPVHQQEGSEDYGVFAIAFTVELAFGSDPHAVIHRQESMRSHLESCLCEGKLSPFPRGQRGKISGRKFATIEVYCTCKLPESFDDMVECEACLTWHHYCCCGYTGKEKQWKCDHCAPKSKRQKY